MKIKRILYPTDFSKNSENAREHAMYMATSLNCEVYLLHAIEPLDYEEMDKEIFEFYRELENKLEKKMNDEKKIFESKGIRTHNEIIIGERWKVINNYALEKEIDLIIIGTHGLKNQTGSISVGTTSHKVMFSSPCPVLVVKQKSA